MHHQGIGSQRQHLVEQEKGNKIAGEGDAHGGGQAHRERGEIPGLVGVMPGPHIADRIDGGENPQAGSQEGKDEAEQVGAQLQRPAGQQLEVAGLNNPAGQHRRQHGDNQQELDGGSNEGPAFAQIRVPVRKQDRPGGEQRNQHGQERVMGHVGTFRLPYGAGAFGRA